MKNEKRNVGWIVMVVTFFLIGLLGIGTIANSVMPSANAAVLRYHGLQQPRKNVEKIETTASQTDLRRNKREPQYYGQNNPYGYQQTSNFGGGALSSAGRVALTHAGSQIVSAAGNEVIDRNGLLDTRTSDNNYGGFLAGGAAGGVAIGAAVGSVVPGLGTALGAAGGAILGSGVAYLGAKIMN
ncbi:uncharacterized protein LOC108738020 [Agrilus planipennis]|uniref:Uncharacterized protein LOC108738020 n=1 Tax=Agrilus planipennis TaxID=224129 RepID=A0A1W4WS55_AGRPL|nr:uncharacterized protein LOC108738020 [Agrilus planipennis]